MCFKEIGLRNTRGGLDMSKILSSITVTARCHLQWLINHNFFHQRLREVCDIVHIL